MSYKIDQSTVQLNSIDRKLLLSNIPVIISLLIFIGLTTDSARRIMESSFRETDINSTKANAGNFEKDLNSFSDSDNAAGFLTALEDELTTVVSFEPKLPELRSAMATLFQGFNENIADWSEDEIPNVEAFKTRISTLTANLEAVSDDNLLDVLRLVKAEIDSFSAQIQTWVHGLDDAQFDPSMLVAMFEILGGAAFMLGVMAVVGRAKNGLVQQRYEAISTKEEAIKEIVKFKQIPNNITSFEDAKDALLKLLVEIGAILQSYSYLFASYQTWYKENLITLYDLPADDIGHTFDIIKENLEKFFNRLRNSFNYSFSTDNRLREYMRRLEAMGKRYEEIAAAELNPNDGDVEHVLVETNQISDQEPTLLRVIGTTLSGIVAELLDINRSLVVDKSTLAFGQSISNSMENFTHAVSTNNRKKATHYIQKIVYAINRLKNENTKASELFEVKDVSSILGELETFLNVLSEA